MGVRPNHHHLHGHTVAHRAITHPNHPHIKARITDRGTAADRTRHTHQATTCLKKLRHLARGFHGKSLWGWVVHEEWCSDLG